MFLKLNGVEILTSQLIWSPVAEPVIVLSKTTLVTLSLLMFLETSKAQFCSRRHHLPGSA